MGGDAAEEEGVEIREGEMDGGWRMMIITITIMAMIMEDLNWGPEARHSKYTHEDTVLITGDSNPFNRRLSRTPSYQTRPLYHSILFNRCASNLRSIHILAQSNLSTLLHSSLSHPPTPYKSSLQTPTISATPSLSTCHLPQFIQHLHPISVNLRTILFKHYIGHMEPN